MGALQNSAIVAQRGLSRAEAAHYVGVGVRLFDQLVSADQMPPARALGGKFVWDIRELDDAFDQLPHIGDHQARVADKPKPDDPDPAADDFV